MDSKEHPVVKQHDKATSLQSKVNKLEKHLFSVSINLEKKVNSKFPLETIH